MDKQHLSPTGSSTPAGQATQQSSQFTETDLLHMVQRTVNRRRFLSGIGLTGAAIASGSVLSGCSNDTVAAAGPSQTDVLNFALNLEFLESIFYSYAVTGSLTGAGLTTTLLGGTPTITGAPPAKIAISNSLISDLVAEICFDEVSHVKDLVTVLGPAAIACPAINLAALGTVNSTNVLTAGRLFEDVGVSAYAGAATLLTGQNLQYAAQILAVEGFHAATLRLAALQLGPTAGGGPVGTTITLPDGLDVQPGDPGPNVYSTGPTKAAGFFATTFPTSTFEPTTPGLAYTRTTSQVLAIVYGNTAAGTASGGFFPNGVNGNIKSV